MADPTEPPLSPDRLRHLRLSLRKTVPGHGLGAHLRRKQGQSLQFQDYRAYQRGDDIRAVDWRASLRQGDDSDLIIKTFEAEERLTLALVVDTRPAMRLPLAAPKLTYALWAMRCLAQIAGEAGDDVILATVFGPRDVAPVNARGRAVHAAARRFAQEIHAAAPAPLEAEPVANVDALLAALKPASVVVLVSDMLFAEGDGAVTRLALAAQRSRRELFVLELDTLAMEGAALRKSATARLASVEGRMFGDTAYGMGEGLFAAVQAEVDRLLLARRAAWARGGLIWPAPVVWPEGLSQAGLQGLFTAGFPASPVLRGIAARGAV